MYEIKKNIQLPDKFGSGRPRIYPFDKCDVGDGFEVKATKHASVRCCVQYWVRTGGVGQRWTIRRSAAGGYTVKRLV